MSKKKENGKINLFDETWFPKISHLLSSLGERERLAIVALVEKDPSETWETVARRLGITSRQLFNIRQNEKVQEACYTISKEHFKSDVPDVLKMLTKKAKAGENFAMRLFLEIAGEVRTKGEQPIDPPHLLGLSDTAKEKLKLLSSIPENELQEELVKRLHLSQDGVKAFGNGEHQEGGKYDIVTKNN